MLHNVRGEIHNVSRIRTAPPERTSSWVTLSFGTGRLPSTTQRYQSGVLGKVERRIDQG